MIQLNFIARFAIRISQAIWWLFLTSGPLFYIADDLFDWPYRILSMVVDEYIIVYLSILFLVFLLVLVITKKLYNITLVILILFGIATESGIFRVIGFRWYVYPEKIYLKSHCNTVSFVQNKKIQMVGLCDRKPDREGLLAGNGPMFEPFFYDTSGDIKDYYLLGKIEHDESKKEWVDAVRHLFHDDPNEDFEFYPIEAFPVGDHFYGISFDYDYPNDEYDDPGNAGFTADYGSPPHEKN